MNENVEKLVYVIEDTKVDNKNENGAKFQIGGKIGKGYTKVEDVKGVNENNESKVKDYLSYDGNKNKSDFSGDKSEKEKGLEKIWNVFINFEVRFSIYYCFY